MHVSEAFPRAYAALAEALDSLGFRARDAWIFEMLVAELKVWSEAEAELELALPTARDIVFQGDGTVTVVPLYHALHFKRACALAETLLGKHRDEPSDPRFLA